MFETSAAGAASWQVAAGIVLFAACSLFILADRFNRAAVALSAAAAAIVLGLVPLKTAFISYINWQALLLLAGMMVLTGVSGKSGLYAYLAVKSAQQTRGRPALLLLYQLGLSAAVGAVLDPLSAVLVLAPPVYVLCGHLGVPPLPAIIAVAMGTHIGGTASLIGNTANLLIGTTNGMSAAAFPMRLLPVSLLVLAAAWFILWRSFRGSTEADAKKLAALRKENAEAQIRNTKLLIASLSAFFIMTIGFLVEPLLSVGVGTIAAGSAVVLAAVCYPLLKPRDYADFMDWTQLGLLAGALILAGGLAETGVLGNLASRILELSDGRPVFAALLILWAAGLLAAVWEPAALAAFFVPLVGFIQAHLNAGGSPSAAILWWALALGAGFGANGTPFASPANLAAAGYLAREGASFKASQFVKAGLPVTLIALALSSLYLVLFLD